MFRLVPMSNVTVRPYDPSLEHVDDMYSMPSTPFTCSSIGVPTVSQTTCAAAPGYEVATCTVGGVICGYCSTGSERSVTRPKITVTMAMTLAKIGRSMKKRGIMRRQARYEAAGAAAPCGVDSVDGISVRFGLTTPPGLARCRPPTTTHS